jgi:PPP family 3-phenylpropionic acid transporter
MTKLSARRVAGVPSLQKRNQERRAAKKLKRPYPYWRLSGFYFFYFATLGAFLPYWSLYLAHQGFNARQIGELTALLVGTKVIAPNLWGWVADRVGRSLGIIRMASFFSAALFCAFLLPLDFFGYACATVLFSSFWNASLPQFEAATLFHLRADSHRYSEIRLWGSVGFIGSVLGIGSWLDTQPIALLPYIIIGLLSCIWLMSLLTPEASAAHHEDAVPGMLQILKKPEVLAFFAVYVLLQTAHGPYYTFYSIYLHDYRYSATVTGILWSLGVGAEIVLFMLMRRLLQRVSLRRVLLLSVALSTVRWLLIAAYAQTLYWLVAAQLLHAASFGAAHVTAIHLVQRYFGARHQGKGQALYSSLSFGLGGMFGSLFSGYYWDVLGGRTVFALAAVFCALAFIIALLWVGRENASKTGVFALK